MENHAAQTDGTLNSLSEKITLLQSQVEQLRNRIDALEQSRAGADREAAPRAPARPQPQASEQVRQAPPPLLDTAALLPRIATVCFLLVVALILRTITDNQMIDIRAGSILGMTYAGALILLGWPLYGKNSRLAPIFPGCGILLLFSIVLETHAHFESLSATAAYTILFLAGATVFAMSIHYRASLLICLSVPAAAAVAAAIDFPYPNFKVLGLLLLAAIIASSHAFRRGICRYLRWFVLAITSLFWLLWTTKLDNIPSCAEPVAEALDPDMFFPMLFTFWGTYLVTVTLNLLRKDQQPAFFESITPTIAAMGAFLSGYVAISNWFQEETWFYASMVVIAALHLGMAWLLARRDREKSSGVNVFIMAGAAIIILTSAGYFKNLDSILPVWSAIGFFTALLSGLLHNEEVRLTSYLLQTAACIALIQVGAPLMPPEAPLAAGIAAFSICLFSLLQYRWCRTHPPVKEHSFFFSVLDKRNHTAVILLATGLLGGYFLARLLVYQGLSGMAADIGPMFESGKSLLINAGALILMYIALKGRNKEIIIVGTIVALIGGAKVIFLDLFGGLKGAPLVLSVFSTGLVAAFGSVVMGRWQKKKPETAEAVPG